VNSAKLLKGHNVIELHWCRFYYLVCLLTSHAAACLALAAARGTAASCSSCCLAMSCQLASQELLS